nr:GPO family capsid scaffolding protein [uncultured Desulfobacter sp.]
MPGSLVTDWKRIAKSGPTVDGRKIDPQWLKDMAETYNPDEYTAKLWIDHRRYMGSYGSVREVKAEQDGDVVRLFAKISPSRDLIERNQVWEDKLHFSIEVIENFAETGKFYLGGLAMTDEPASLGTDEMRFSTNPDRTFTARYPGDPVPDLRDAADDETAFTLFRRLLQIFSKSKPETEIKEEEPMDQKQFDELKGEFKKSLDAVSGLAERLDAFMAAGHPPQDDVADTPDDSGDDNATPPAEDFTELKTGLDDLGKKFDSLVERMEKAVPGTRFTETTAPAGDEDELL